MGGQLKDVFIKWPNTGHRLNGLNIWKSKLFPIFYNGMCRCGKKRRCGTCERVVYETGKNNWKRGNEEITSNVTESKVESK